MWWYLGGLAVGVLALVGRGAYRRSQQDRAADASGLAPAHDLSHLPVALQRTALWCLADGGFERRVVHGGVARAGADVDVTAFALETLRERRGEWAWLPVEPPFRIGGVVSVVACELDRAFPHILIKREGQGDRLLDDDRLDRLGHVAKTVRDGFGLARSYAAELPSTLPAAPVAVALPAGWRAYTATPDRIAELVAGGLHAALAQANRRDLVIELLDELVVVYPASHAAVGPDAFADLTATALALVDGIRASATTPRGVEVTSG